MTRTTDLAQDLKRTRDELKLQMHLASMDAKEEWEALETKWENFATRARLEDTSEDLGETMRMLGEELMMGYERIKAALESRNR